jgi:TatD DNase family protein
MTSRAVRLTDTHCHLNLPAFDEDLPETIARARRAGVARMLIPGMDIESSRRAIEIAAAHEGVYAAVGVHPHHAASWEASYPAEIRTLAQSPKVVAIGEIGLDYYRNLSPRHQQVRAMKEQLALARELELPVVIHNRDSIADVLDAISEWSQALGKELEGRRGVLHAYSADRDSAARALEIGFFLGVAGPITYRNAHERREIMLELPLDRILVETDSPYLTPEPHRGQRNEPGYVRHIATKISTLFDLDLVEVAEYTTHNAEILFRWDDGREDSHLL